jgi:hypothetical protein
MGLIIMRQALIKLRKLIVHLKDKIGVNPKSQGTLRIVRKRGLKVKEVSKRRNKWKNAKLRKIEAQRIQILNIKKGRNLLEKI